MRRICPGYRPADGIEPVARARRVKRRPREQSAEWQSLPEAMRRICPGYRSADGTEPVARARRVKRRPREQSAEWQNFPEAMLRICPGYRPADGFEPAGRARRQPPPSTKPAHHSFTCFRVRYPLHTRVKVVSQHSAPKIHASQANHAGNRQLSTNSAMVSVPSVNPPR